MPLTNDMMRSQQMAEPDARPARPSSRERSYSEETITPESSLTVSAVIAIITVMSQDISSIPLFLYARRGRSKFRAYDSPYYALMHDQPNPEHTSMVFREFIMSHLIAWGNFFAQKIIDEAGTVVELWPLRPDRMTVKRFEGERIYLYSGSNGKPRTFLQEEILHIPGFGFDGLIGYSRIALARHSIGLSISTEKYGSKFYSNDAKPGHVYKHPKRLSDPAYKHLQESLEERKGVDQSHLPIILEENMSVEKLGISNDDAQFLETRSFQIAEINRILGPVPPFRIADVDRSTSWGTGIDSQEQGYINHTLLPYAVRTEQGLNSQLLLKQDRDQGYFYEHLFDAFLRGDIATRYEAYTKSITNGFMSRNEVRERENMNPRKGLDDMLQPLNMTTVTSTSTGGGSPLDGSGEDNAASALEPLWKDAIARVMKREKNDLLGASKRWQVKGMTAEFENWAENFYRDEHAEFMSKQFEPLIEAQLRLSGIDLHTQMSIFTFDFLSNRLAQVKTMNADELALSMDAYIAGSTEGMMDAISSLVYFVGPGRNRGN